MFNLLLIFQLASISILFVEAAYIFIHWRTRLQGVLFFSCVVTLINNVGYFLEMTADTQGEYLVGLKMSYLGRVYIPFALLLFTLNLCNIEYNKIFIRFLAVIHVITAILVYTCEYNNLYYTEMVYVTDDVFPYLKMGHGIWYILYSALIFIYIIYGIGNLIIAARKETDQTAKKRLNFVITSIALESAFYSLGFTPIFGCYDPTQIGYTVGAIFMCIAIFKYNLLSTLEVAREFVIEDIPEGVVVINQNGVREYQNKTANSIFEEASGREVYLSIEEALKKKEPLHIKDRFYSPQKKELSRNGVSQGTVYVLVDDTDKIKYVEDLREQKEIAEKAREEAERLSASKSSFLSVVSHEIRTPMNAVVGMTDLLLREKDKLTEKQELYLRNIKNSGSALVMIVNDILDQSKIESGKMEIIEEPYELRPMVSDVNLIIENRIGNKPIKLITDIEEEVPQYLVGDSLRIRQILINLMNNAVKFTTEGFIQLSVKVVSKEENSLALRFGIKDSGQGIKPEDLSRLGEAFSQVDTKKNHGKEGTGLGLSISKDFIAMMGGALEVSSTYGEGSEFFFTINQGIADGLKEEESTEVTKQAWQEEAEFEAKEASILIVDDTKINLVIAKELLVSLKMNVDTATSGEEAIEKVKACKYDVIFMDYMMPYMDGIEATAKIRELGVDTPIIALTGDTSEDTMARFKEAGVDDYTEKPVHLKRLKKLLLRWLPKEKITKVEDKDE